jgi:hypothetical protein
MVAISTFLQINDRNQEWQLHARSGPSALRNCRYSRLLGFCVAPEGRFISMDGSGILVRFDLQRSAATTAKD